ncbi:hypothetical protein LTR86_004238 [Recurvomyces mirabilis]|nr:hypothetical protein LTR86_004238 [Recurvomyces mirabilis]
MLKLAQKLALVQSIRQFKVLELPLYKESELFSVNVTIGPPPQPHSMWVDTGSSSTWIKASRFDMSSSATARTVSDEGLDLTYFNHAHVTGDIIRDDFGIGSAVVHNMTIGLAEIVDSTAHILTSGILALAPMDYRPNDISQGGLLEKLVEQGAINTRTVALWLDHGREKPSMIIGGYDKTKYMGNLTVFPMRPTPGFSVTWRFCGVNVSSMALTTPDGSSKSVVSPEFNSYFMMDSGGADSYFPSSVVETLVAMLQPYGLIKGSRRGSYMAPCDIVDQPGGLDLGFLGGRGDGKGPRYRIHFRGLFGDIEEVGPDRMVETKIGACEGSE